MREIILHETRRQNGHIVLTALAGTTITVDNILGIINKTTGKVVYTPLKYGTISVGTVVLSDGTYQEIIFGQDVPEQPAGSEFFIKAYTDDAAGGYDEMIAQFFGLPQALPQFTYATDQEVIDIVDDVYNDYFPTIGQTSEQNNND